MKMEEFAFRQLDLDGVSLLMDWAANEGWNPGPHDAEVFWETDPDGFYGFFDGDRLIAGGAIISYDRAFGFMGLFIVHPDYRDRGIGRRLWHLRRNLLQQRLHPGATIGMDGVVAMQNFYSQGGFELAYREERYACMGQGFLLHPCVSPIHSADHVDVLRYDLACFGFSRPRFLLPWLKIPGNISFRYVDQGQTLGYTVIRKAMEGYKAGPLFADNREVAEALFRAGLDAVGGEVLYLDVPVVNQDALDMVHKYKARYVFECGRMYKGSAPQLSLEKIYGVTTFELG
ncbi:MAG: GNAT family N-acetyltransferase [Lentimicrobiaceae bacterium]|nr:GNAT family N-acetyltransferase [Lentimicrobiaceae bacterium]